MILPILIDAKCKDRDLEELAGLSQIQRIKAVPLGDLDALESVLSRIRKEYEQHLAGEVGVFESIESLCEDIEKHHPAQLQIFLIDGGTTLRRLLREDFVGRLIAGSPVKSLNVQCLLVDAACKQVVLSSRAAAGKPGLREIDDDTYSAIFEGLLQGSRWIHNNGPHETDLADSFGTLTELSAKWPGVFQSESRIVPVLPVTRLLITEHFTYIPAFLPLEDGLKRSRLDYYALRFAAETHIHAVATNYFSHYWAKGGPFP